MPRRVARPWLRVVVTVVILWLSFVGPSQVWGLQDGRTTINRDNVSTLRRITTLDLDDSAVLLNRGVWPTRIVFSPDGRFLAVGMRAGEISLFSVESLQKVINFQGYLQLFDKIVFGHSGTVLFAAGSHDPILSANPFHYLHAWDLEIGSALPLDYFHLSDGMDFSLRSDGDIVVATDNEARLIGFRLDSTAKRYERLELDVNLQLRAEVPNCVTVAFSPDGASLACGNLNGSVTKVIWDGRAFPSFTLDVGHGQVRQVVFDPSGDILASTHDDGAVVLVPWNLMTVRELTPGRSYFHNERPRITFSPTESIVAVSRQRAILDRPIYANELIEFYDYQTGEFLAELGGSSPWYATDIAFSPDGSLVAVARLNETVELWGILGSQGN